MEITGVAPLTSNATGNRRPTYKKWLAALETAAATAASQIEDAEGDLFSLRIELRLYDPTDQGSDLDNYVKPIQDALAAAGVFGETTRKGSTMKGDEHVDHLELRRKRVASESEAGVLAEVWALD